MLMADHIPAPEATQAYPPGWLRDLPIAAKLCERAEGAGLSELPEAIGCGAANSVVRGTRGSRGCTPTKMSRRTCGIPAGRWAKACARWSCGIAAIDGRCPVKTCMASPDCSQCRRSTRPEGNEATRQRGTKGRPLVGRLCGGGSKATPVRG